MGAQLQISPTWSEASTPGPSPRTPTTAGTSGSWRRPIARWATITFHHDDAEREWAYDRESSIGRLDRGVDESAERGWTVVSMKNDWRTVFAFEE